MESPAVSVSGMGTSAVFSVEWSTASSAHTRPPAALSLRALSRVFHAWNQSSAVFSAPKVSLISWSSTRGASGHIVAAGADLGDRPICQAVAPSPSPNAAGELTVASAPVRRATSATRLVEDSGPLPSYTIAFSHTTSFPTQLVRMLLHCAPPAAGPEVRSQLSPCVLR